eukprot:5673237-Amphidinium_carterae.1
MPHDSVCTFHGEGVNGCRLSSLFISMHMLSELLSPRRRWLLSSDSKGEARMHEPQGYDSMTRRCLGGGP